MIERLNSRTGPSPEMGLLMLAGMNGWVARLLAGDTVALSLFGPLALSVALLFIYEHNTVSLPNWLLGLTGLLILFPSGSAAWIAMAFLAIFCRWPPAARLLVLGLATAELFATVGLNYGKGIILPGEAHLAGYALELSGFSPIVFGNTIELYDRFTIVAAGCSGIGGAIFAGLAVTAIVWWRAPETRPIVLLPMILVAMICAFAINILRISLMAVDSEFYAIAHGQTGAFIADLISSLMVISLALFAERLRE